MKLQTDPEVVEKLAKEREGENWDYRAFLKMNIADMKKLDAIVHKHAEDVAEQIDCGACANCCRKVSPVLSESDVENLAAGLDLSSSEVKDRFLTVQENGQGYVFDQKPCPFLSDNECTVYACRPSDCRQFPHLHKEGFLRRTMQAMRNCEICPIVFNVYERLKDELWRSPVDAWSEGFGGESCFDDK